MSKKKLWGPTTKLYLCSEMLPTFQQQLALLLFNIPYSSYKNKKLTTHFTKKINSAFQLKFLLFCFLNMTIFLQLYNILTSRSWHFIQNKELSWSWMNVSLIGKSLFLFILGKTKPVRTQRGGDWGLFIFKFNNFISVNNIQLIMQL